MSNEEREFEIVQDDMLVASACGDNALNEIKHYAAQYEQDGPIKVYEVIRREVNLAAPSAASDAPGLPPLPEPLAIDWPTVHSSALGCGVEDRNIRDRYEAAEYGFEDGVQKAACCVPDVIYDADQMQAYARAAISASQAAPKERLTLQQLNQLAAKHIKDVCGVERKPATMGEDHEFIIMCRAIEAATAPHPQLVAALAEGAQLNTPDFMDWIAARMVNVYGERDNIDFVLTLRDRAAKIRAALAAAGESPSPAASDVLAERRRQVGAEDWSHEHDDAHPSGEIAAFAAVYAMPEAAREWDASSTGYGDTLADALTPHDWQPKFGGRRRDLVKAGALILAEIERLDRAEAKGQQP